MLIQYEEASRGVRCSDSGIPEGKGEKEARLGQESG